MTDISTCDECERSLYGTEPRNGWVTIDCGWHHQARVHTLCRSAFTRRPLAEQKARAAIDTTPVVADPAAWQAVARSIR